MRCPACSRKLATPNHCPKCDWSGEYGPRDDSRMWSNYAAMVEGLVRKESRSRPWITDEMMEELRGSAQIGFVLALRGWKPDAGAEFITYAHRSVRNALLDEIYRLQNSPSLWGFELPQEGEDEFRTHPDALITHPVRDGRDFLAELQSLLSDNPHGLELIRVVLEGELEMKEETPAQTLRAARKQLLNRTRRAGGHKGRWQVEQFAQARNAVRKALEAV